MHNKKIVTCLVFVLLLASSVHTQGMSSVLKLFAKPEFFLVFRVEMSPEVDPSFYEQYWKKRNEKPSQDSYVNGKLDNTISLLYKLDWKEFEFTAPLSRDPYMVVRCVTPASGTVTLNNIRFQPADHPLFGVILPLEAEFTVPQDAQYVYLGTLKYDWEGVRFDTTGPQRLNHIEEAQLFVTEYYGPDAKLIPAFIPKLPFIKN